MGCVVFMDLRKGAKHSKQNVDIFSINDQRSVFVDNGQVNALRTLYNSQPAVLACRAILLGELLSNGISIFMDGKKVTPTSDFAQLLDSDWVEFAKDIIDSFLVAGYCVVTFPKDKFAAKNGAVPLCAPFETFRLAYHYNDNPYCRSYEVYPTNTNDEKKDPDAVVHIRQAPDQYGNVVSPMASTYEIGQAHLAFLEMAVKAETLRSKQLLVTQPSEKKTTDDALAASSMFFGAFPTIQ